MAHAAVGSSRGTCAIHDARSPCRGVPVVIGSFTAVSGRVRLCCTCCQRLSAMDALTKHAYMLQQDFVCPVCGRAFDMQAALDAHSAHTHGGADHDDDHSHHPTDDDYHHQTDDDNQTRT